ncbi:carboxypeptidase B-like isoform X2 [Copidosoma floridanum]|uniref:carboxypeptidase B-like isoform X2 n=1 Tax=Copidosoma floridanum TaxID=29053 RepID=UPI0006C99080|nr:carboxypeptidase B-like isoform X2 [Copidosoma floridanum]
MATIFGYDPTHSVTSILCCSEITILQSFHKISKTRNLSKSKVLHDDVGLLLEKNTTVHSSKRKVRSVSHEEKAAAEFNFQYFPRYDEIVKFMENLVLNRYAKLINIGSSAEGRPIYGIEVSKYANNPVFLIDAGTHAREWASHVSALYIIQQVIENEEEFANKLNLVIIPCLNPDGYEYTHTTNRFWRKSRSQQSNRMCPGVDLNRNFDSHFGEFRSDTSNVCSRLFAGKRAFSEPESAALRDTILAYKPIAYLSIHSFGGYLLYPYGYTKILPQNWQTLDRIAKLVVERAKEFSGTEYKYGSAARLLYKASGASDDWAMDKGNVSLVFTIELPAYSDRAFIVPEDKIMTLVQETFETFLAMFNEIFNYTKSYTFSRT